MSANNLGIPLSFGLTFGYNEDNSFLNGAPDILSVKFIKTINTVDTISDLENYDVTNIKNGYTIEVKNDSNETNNAQYFWNGKEWIKIGNLNCSSYLNIYSNILDENDEKIISSDFFMRIYLNNIQSNIRLIQFLNTDFGIYNTNIVTFLGLNGSYNMNLNEVLNNLLYININSALNILIRKLSNKYNISYTEPKNLSISIVKALYDIIGKSNTLFYQLSREINKIDLSMYTNFISACFSSFKYILESKYEKISTILFNNDIELQLIDQTFYDRIENNNDIKLFAQEFLQIISDITYNNKNENSFFLELNKLINYFNKNNTHIIRIKKNRIQLYKDLCEGIAGIVNLSLLFSIISNCTYGSKNAIYFHFIIPENFSQYH